MNALDQIKDRKLVRWAAAYLAGAWLTLQVSSVLANAFDWPPFALRALTVVLAVGFAVALVLAWYHGERGAQRVSGTEASILTGLLVLIGLGVALLAPGGEEARAAEGPRAAAIPAERASLAVLPFENLSTDPEQAYFAAGITEELTRNLALVPGLRVAARTSAQAFGGGGATADSVGRALGVAFLVEGTVRAVGDRVRVTAELVEAASGFRQWSETYDRPVADVFGVQEEIGRAIANELRFQVSREVFAAGTDDTEARALLIRAYQPVYDLAEKERLARAALARDPSFASAHSLLATVLFSRAYNREIEQESGHAEARAEAERALALAPEDPGVQARAYIVLGFLAEGVDWDFPAAERLLRRAVEADPNYAFALVQHANVLAYLGQTREAIREGERAARLDPLSPDPLYYLSVFYGYAGNAERAVAQARAALNLNGEEALLPNFLANLSQALTLAGQHGEAVETADRALQLIEGGQGYSGTDISSTLVTGVFARARAGDRAGTEALAARLDADYPTFYYQRASAAAALGDADRAFALLGRAIATRNENLPWLGVDPVFAPYRSDPRMTSLLERIGLPPTDR